MNQSMHKLSSFYRMMTSLTLKIRFYGHKMRYNFFEKKKTICEKWNVIFRN